MKKWIFIGIILVVVNLVIFTLSDIRHTGTVDSVEQSQGSVTLENYKKVEMDMTKAEVFKLLGEGKETAKASQGKLVVTSYSWTSGHFGANCSVMFQNGKVTNKAQIGLK